MDLKIEYTDKELTPWGGMVLMKQLLERTGINQVLRKIGIPIQGSNHGYDPIQLVNNFWIGLWSGASRYEHLEVTRQDHVIQKIFGWKKMAGHKAFQRYFKKFRQGENDRIFTELFQWYFEQLTFDNYTLDIDSTIMTRYGEQEGAKRGYNMKKPGRKSHHPLLAFLAEPRMAVNFWLRSGDAHTANNFYAFIENTFERLKGKTIGLLRADSGFYDQKILKFLENRRQAINYIIAVRFYHPVKRAIAQTASFLRVDDGIEIGETVYKGVGWERERRFIIVRQAIAVRPKASGKQLRLAFPDAETYQNYRYSCFVTNLTLPAKAVWDLYRNRADAENRIKELKEDFGVESFNVEDFYATEAALNFVIMGYNLMSLFRQTILQSPRQAQLKTLRYKIFAIGAYLTKNGNEKILKLSLAMKRRKWFDGLWATSGTFTWPYVVDNVKP
jgi:hypothetical protein